jgi:HK97 family phage portal protein
MTFVPFGVPPETSQMLETRRYQTEEICRWFRVPSHKVGERDGITYGAMEQMEIAYANDSLGPWLARWEQEAVRKLLTPAERDTISVTHDLQGTLKGTHKDRADYMMKLFQIGGLTIDEVRQLNDRDPLPDGLGDSAYVQTNMAPVGMSPMEAEQQDPEDDNQPPSEEVNEDDSENQL